MTRFSYRDTFQSACHGISNEIKAKLGKDYPIASIEVWNRIQPLRQTLVSELWGPF